MIPLPLRLAGVFVLGAFLGSLVNWAIYSLAWNPRAISPWSRLPADGPSRSRADRLPIVGWWWLRREIALYGRGFWIRPLMLELGMGISLAALYWWEVARLGLIQDQVGAGFAISPPWVALHLQYLSHVILLCWMLPASFIDIDEKLIPDEITVTGTLLGLLLATIVPTSLLPQIEERTAKPIVGQIVENAAGGPVLGPNGDSPWLEPVTAIAPEPWPPAWGQPRTLTSLVVGLACYWLWCFALAPRIWRGRRGAFFALRLIVRRLWREFGRPPLRSLALVGTAAIASVWLIGGTPWSGLLTALVGLVGGGGIVWGVRLMGTASLRREAMGFGDVTLMMMVGTFLGWQACIIAFFLAPFAAIVIGVAQLILRHDDVIPFGPFLCTASAGVVVAWAPTWSWAQELFRIPGLVIVVLFVCLMLLGLMLAVWRMIKTALFGV
jgi:prepilin signal peptidase PulO-like enzyme (type II secretory pathway)